MPKSYRFRTEVGVDKEVRLNIDQDFDFLEILSLKFKQEDLYDRFCADYGVVAGRVVVNGGFGVPNVNVSIFVPLDNIDEQDPIISTLYPYKKITDKNEDGYRYNLLPYEQEYGGHTPTGTFPSRDDVLTRNEVLQVYEKYYRYTVKTNESGDFMIFGVPLGQQKVVMDLDLSNIGQFSLRPADLIRMGRGVKTQFNGQQFKSSEDLNSLPQIVNIIKEIEVYPFWGENDICDVGITRTDFDLRDEGIEINPTSIFMGSIFSTVKDEYLRANCKPKNKSGKLCDLETGPGQILALRQTIDVDFSGRPIIEEYKLEEGGNVIDSDGVWMIDLPMNLDYVTTNEFGEQIISPDPKNGIPTKGRYRFKIKYQNEGGLDEDVLRANYLVPNIKEHGWSGSTTNEMPSEEDRNKSYAFSLNWDDYYDSDAAINCNDSFYEFNYNKVYTVASHIDRFKWGFNRNKHLGIKEINDDTCRSTNNTPPVNDASRRNSPFIFLFNFLLSIVTVPLVTLIIIAHVLAFIYPILRIIINIIVAIINGIIYALCKAVAWIPGVNLECNKSTITPLPKDNPFKTIALPMMSYPDCEACECKTSPTDNSSEQEESALQAESDMAFGALFDATTTSAFEYDPIQSAASYECPDYYPGMQNTYLYRLQQQLLGSGSENNNDNGYYRDLILENDSLAGGTDKDQKEWYKSPIYPVFKDFGADNNNGYKIRWKFQYNPTWAQALNLMNRRHMYFGDNGNSGLFWTMQNSTGFRTTNRMQVKCVNDEFGPQDGTSWTDMCNVFLFDPGTEVKTGSLMTFNDLNNIVDPNLDTHSGGNQFGNTSITGQTNGNPNGYTTVPVPYVKVNGQQGTGYANLVVTGTTSFYTFKSGVEYFQVLTAMTINELSTKLKPDELNSLLNKFVRRYRTKHGCSLGSDLEDGFESSYKSTEHAVDWENIVVGFFVRGVDVYTPRQKMRYDLSKLFGWGVYDENVYVGNVVVEGDYYMNVPIQPNYGDSNDDWWSSYKSPSPHYELDGNNVGGTNLPWNSGTNGDGNNWTPSNRLYHTSYTFTPKQSDWESFKTYSFNKYVSLDGQCNNRMAGYMGEFATNVESENFPDSGLNPWMQRGIEGCGYQWADYTGTGEDKRERRLDESSHRITSVCSLYLPKNFEGNGDGTYPNDVPYTDMVRHDKIVFRSDRLPSGDVFENFDGDRKTFRRYVLHMNNVQKIYFISDDGVITTGAGGEVVGAADDSGISADDLEDANQTVSNVISSFSCGGMVPLGCYEGEGDEFDIQNPCYLSDNQVWTGSERVVNGCYNFVIKRVILSIPRDLILFFEWRTRIRFMYALCQGIIGEMFQNNWLNGTLYMPAFQKQTLFNSDNEPRRYRYCGDPQQFWDNRKNQGPLYFNTDTNSFFYRSTPFNDEDNQFVGQEPGRPYYTGQNKKNIWSPTTIMELGPRDEFTKEIAFSPEFEGYFVDLVTSSSYKDISTIINLFAVSRLANSNFLENLLSAGDASIGAIFSREFDTIADGTAFADFITNPFDSRIDGDFAQMISINSEFGVLPYLDGNYEDSITVADDRFGIWFSSNTQNRRLITNGVTTFGTEVDGPTNRFGYPNSQVIPYYMWRIKDNGLFGTEQNTWETSCVYSSPYQGDDFFDGSGKYMKPDAGYGLGYIYNKNSNGSELDAFPTNSPNACDDSSSGGVIVDLLSDGLARGNFKVGNPFHFYFGLRRGKTAMNRYIQKYIFDLE